MADSPLRSLAAHQLRRAVLALALLLVACGGDARRPLQSAPVVTSPGAVAPFVGRWYDYRGRLVAEIAGGRRATATVRLYSDVELLGAHTAGGALVFAGARDGEPFDLALRPVSPDTLSLAPHGGPLAGCAACAMLVHRHDRAWAAGRRMVLLRLALRREASSLRSRLSVP